MARKKIIDSNACKFSLFISGDNKETLDELTDNYQLKYGPMINKIIGIFCRMPRAVKKVFETTCNSEYKRLTKEISQANDDFHKKALEEEKNLYYEILRLINNGKYKISEEISANNIMKKIEIADGYLIIPADWIVVNQEQAKYCRYAAVLECKNSDRYNVPHFIYFNNCKYANQYTESLEKDFYKLCEKKWDRFSEIEKISNDSQLIPDPNNEGHYLNLDEYLQSPIIGLFSIEEQSKDEKKEYPFNAMIVRN